MNKLLLIPFFAIILFSGSILPSANASFLTPVEIIDLTGAGGGKTLDNPGGIATDSFGNVFVAGRGSDNVFKITPSGTITEIIDGTGDVSNSLKGPNDVTTDLSGNVFVAGTGSNNVFKITPGGVITEIIDLTGAGGGKPLDTPAGVATDSFGNVFVTGVLSDNAFKIATPGTCSTGGTACTITEIIDITGDGGGTFTTPGGIATDSFGNVFVEGGFFANAFKIATPGTCSTGGTACTITEIIDITGDGSNGLSDPTGIATDASDNVFVTGGASDNAFKIATPGTCSTGGTACTITEIIDLTGAGGGKTLDAPAGVATDSFGNVFVTGILTDNVFKITPGGTITEIIDSAGDGIGNTLDAPLRMATDLSGNVFVTGRGSDNAFKIELDVSGSVIGGTILPLDTTSLLLAGAQSFSWMIPVIVSAVGIGIFITRKL